jgi:multimeric flavodoxin WrbA
LQYVRYMMRMHPHHHYEIHDVARDVDELASSHQRWASLLAAVSSSDLVVWTTPVYSYFVPCQLKRFVELIFERGAASVFASKYCTVLSTSTLMYDHATHRYMHAICDDLDMKYLGFFSAEMYDLTRAEKRRAFEIFVDSLLFRIEHGHATTRWYKPIVPQGFVYEPTAPDVRVDSEGRSIVIVTDSENPQDNCSRMVQRLAASFSAAPTIVNLHEVGMRHGCEGVVRCGYDNTCAHHDGYVQFYESVLMPADILVFAGTVKDRFLSSKWKQFWDRSIYQGHVPSLVHKQLAWLVSGPFRQVPCVLEVIDGSTQSQLCTLVDVVTDEDASSARLDALLQQLAEQLIFFHDRDYRKPPTFVGVAGAKVCRHLSLRSRFLFQADYDFMRRGAAHDLPPIDLPNRVANMLLAPALRIPWIRRRFFDRFDDILVYPFKKLLQS